MANLEHTVLNFNEDTVCQSCLLLKAEIICYGCGEGPLPKYLCSSCPHSGKPDTSHVMILVNRSSRLSLSQQSFSSGESQTVPKGSPPPAYTKAVTAESYGMRYIDPHEEATASPRPDVKNITDSHEKICNSTDRVLQGYTSLYTEDQPPMIEMTGRGSASSDSVSSFFSQDSRSITCSSQCSNEITQVGLPISSTSSITSTCKILPIYSENCVTSPGRREGSSHRVANSSSSTAIEADDLEAPRVEQDVTSEGTIGKTTESGEHVLPPADTGEELTTSEDRDLRHTANGRKDVSVEDHLGIEILDDRSTHTSIEDPERAVDTNGSTDAADHCARSHSPTSASFSDYGGFQGLVKEACKNKPDCEATAVHNAGCDSDQQERRTSPYEPENQGLSINAVQPDTDTAPAASSKNTEGETRDSQEFDSQADVDNGSIESVSLSIVPGDDAAFESDQALKPTDDIHVEKKVAWQDNSTPEGISVTQFSIDIPGQIMLGLPQPTCETGTDKEFQHVLPAKDKNTIKDRKKACWACWKTFLCVCVMFVVGVACLSWIWAPIVLFLYLDTLDFPPIPIPTGACISPSVCTDVQMINHKILPIGIDLNALFYDPTLRTVIPWHVTGFKNNQSAFFSQAGGPKYPGLHVIDNLGRAESVLVPAVSAGACVNHERTMLYSTEIGSALVHRFSIVNGTGPATEVKSLDIDKLYQNAYGSDRLEPHRNLSLIGIDISSNGTLLTGDPKRGTLILIYPNETIRFKTIKLDGVFTHYSFFWYMSWGDNDESIYAIVGKTAAYNYNGLLGECLVVKLRVPSSSEISAADVEWHVTLADVWNIKYVGGLVYIMHQTTKSYYTLSNGIGKVTVLSSVEGNIEKNITAWGYPRGVIKDVSGATLVWYKQIPIRPSCP